MLRDTRAEIGSTFLVKQTTGFYPRVGVDGHGSRVVSQAGGVLLVERDTGIDACLSQAAFGAELLGWPRSNQGNSRWHDEGLLAARTLAVPAGELILHPQFHAAMRTSKGDHGDLGSFVEIPGPEIENECG